VSWPRLARWLIKAGRSLSPYQSTDSGRKVLDNWLTAGYSTRTLAGHVQNLTRQCRQLERTVPKVRGIGDGLVADVVGSGIDVDPDTGDTRVDGVIREGWKEWNSACGPDGESLWQIQQMAPREILVAGTALVHLGLDAARRASGKVPYVLTPYEVEWLDGGATALGGNRNVCGVEVNPVSGRRIAYHLRDPDTSFQSGAVLRVPDLAIDGISGMICAFEPRRPRQVLGEPALCAVVERAEQFGETVINEVASSQVAAAFAVFLKQTLPMGNIDGGDKDADGNARYTTEIPRGAVVRGRPGEDPVILTNNRPSPNIGNFAGVIDGELAAATRSTRQWINRDGSGYNYSNARMDQILTARILAPLREVIERHLAIRPYLTVLPYILLRAGIAMRPEYLKHTVLPDSFVYVDPLKDAQAIFYQIQTGQLTHTEACAMRGRNFRASVIKRADEERFLAEHGVTLAEPAPAPAVATVAETEVPNA
jgi:capsid protein